MPSDAAGDRLIRLIADTVPALVAYVGADERYRFTNLGYATWFGAQDVGNEGRHLREVLGEAAYEEIRPYVAAALAGRSIEAELEIP